MKTLSLITFFTSSFISRSSSCIAKSTGTKLYFVISGKKRNSSPCAIIFCNFNLSVYFSFNFLFTSSLISLTISATLPTDSSALGRRIRPEIGTDAWGRKTTDADAAPPGPHPAASAGGAYTTKPSFGFGNLWAMRATSSSRVSPGRATALGSASARGLGGAASAPVVLGPQASAPLSIPPLCFLVFLLLFFFALTRLSFTLLPPTNLTFLLLEYFFLFLEYLDFFLDNFRTGFLEYFLETGINLYNIYKEKI